MSLIIKCNRCRAVIEKPGALVFSPPTTRRSVMVCGKYHLCTKCWDLLKSLIKGET